MLGGFWAFYENLGWAWTYNEVFPYIFLENEWIWLDLENPSSKYIRYFSTAQDGWIEKTLE